MSDVRVRVVGPLLAGVLLAGGCVGTTTRDGGSSAPPTALAPLLPPAKSPAELTADQQLAGKLDAEFASDDYDGLASVIVLAGGRTVYERYFDSNATDHHRVWSVTKSVISTLAGIAIGQGTIPGVDATLAELLPDHAEEMTPVVAGVTLEQLLTMTGGFVDEIPVSGTFVESTLQNHHVAQDTPFRYTLGGPHLIAAILVEATGMPVLDYARDRLFDPLGIPSTPAVPSTWNGYVEDVGSDPSAFGWMVDAHGLHVGGIGLRLRGQDMAKIGLLYLNNGNWQGQQVVPADWIQAATTAHVPVERWYDVGQGFTDAP